MDEKVEYVYFAEDLPTTLPAVPEGDTGMGLIVMVVAVLTTFVVLGALFGAMIALCCVASCRRLSVTPEIVTEVTLLPATPETTLLLVTKASI